MLQRTPEVLLLAGITALFLAAGTAHADSLEAYRKAACETAEDFAGCVANKKPQMFAADTIRWDCRHRFTLSSDDAQSGMIRDEEVEFITTIVSRSFVRPMISRLRRVILPNPPPLRA